VVRHAGVRKTVCFFRADKKYMTFGFTQYKNVVKMTFAKGTALKDRVSLFNSSLEGNVRRAIDIHEGDKVDEEALKNLIRAAVALNLKGKNKSKPKLRRANSKRADWLHRGSRPYLRPYGKGFGAGCLPSQKTRSWYEDGQHAPTSGWAAKRGLIPGAMSVPFGSRVYDSSLRFKR
jgi:hypothetical protein